MSDNMKALQFALADLEQAQKALSNSPAHAHIRERMDKLITDVRRKSISCEKMWPSDRRLSSARPAR